MHTKEQSIGVFDSGVGGISVLKELVQLMPDENYLYFGDSANAPYGKRCTEEIAEEHHHAAHTRLALELL